MQQVATNEAQGNNKDNPMMQQFVMMSTASPIVLFAGQPTGQPARRPQATTQCNFIPQAVPILALAQQWGQPLGRGRGSTCSCNGRSYRNPCSPAQQGIHILFVGGNQMIPYIPAGAQPTRQQNACYSNVVKQ
jgi:hypothetical protein